MAKKHRQIRGLHYPAGRTRVAQVREKANVISNKSLKTQVLLIRAALLRQPCQSLTVLVTLHENGSIGSHVWILGPHWWKCWKGGRIYGLLEEVSLRVDFEQQLLLMQPLLPLCRSRRELSLLHLLPSRSPTPGNKVSLIKCFLL